MLPLCDGERMDKKVASTKATQKPAAHPLRCRGSSAIRPRQKPRRFRFLLILFCSERREPAKKLIADRNDCSEEGAAEFFAGFLMVGGQRGLFLFHPQRGKQPLMLSQVPMFVSAIRFFLRNRNTGCPAAAKSKSKNPAAPSPPPARRGAIRGPGLPTTFPFQHQKPTRRHQITPRLWETSAPPPPNGVQNLRTPAVSN